MVLSARLPRRLLEAPVRRLLRGEATLPPGGQQQTKRSLLFFLDILMFIHRTVLLSRVGDTSDRQRPDISRTGPRYKLSHTTDQRLKTLPSPYHLAPPPPASRRGVRLRLIRLPPALRRSNDTTWFGRTQENCRRNCRTGSGEVRQHRYLKVAGA